jgi:hypothetical protein
MKYEQQSLTRAVRLYVRHDVKAHWQIYVIALWVGLILGWSV